MELIKKKEELKDREEEKGVDIEMNLICKVIRQKLREHNYEKEKRIILDMVLETTRSTKKMGRERSLGINWINYMKDDKDKKMRLINQLVDCIKSCTAKKNKM